MQLIETFGGVEIYLDDDGRFTAIHKNKWVRRSSLSALKKILTTPDRPIECLRFVPHDLYPPRLVVVVGMRKVGRNVTFVTDTGRDVDQHSAYSLYLDNEGARAELAAICAASERAKAAYDAVVAPLRERAQEIALSLTRLSEESYQSAVTQREKDRVVSE